MSLRIVASISCLVLFVGCKSLDGAESADTGVVDSAGADGGVLDSGVANDMMLTQDAGPALHVLFVGNSYTSVNDLPSVVRTLAAASPGAAIEVETDTVDGSYLSSHRTTLMARLAVGGIDRVVLQGQSLEAFVEGEGSFAASASVMSTTLAEADARAVWYATWARRAGDAIYASTHSDPETMAATIDRKYQLAAEVNGDVTARVGMAWQIALTEHPEITLHQGDGSHPTSEGTLLAACVIYQALTGATPQIPDPAPLGVSLETARALCAIAPRARDADSLGRCDGSWVDLQSDPLHCGRCTTSCGADDPCISGVCGCYAGSTGCDHGCFDLSSSSDHCGSCDTSCASGGVCEEALCVCHDSAFHAYLLEGLTALEPACDSRDKYGSYECTKAGHSMCASLDCFNSGLGPPSGHSGDSASWISSISCVNGDLRTTTWATLQTFEAGCDGVTERSGQACASAVSRYCISEGSVSGFGPVDETGDEITVTCLPHATLVHATTSDVATHASRCTPDPVTCSVAAFSYCETAGYVGGFGPVEVAGDEMQVVCFDE